MEVVTRDDVQRRSPETQLVDALPADDFAWAHLPGATNMPLRKLVDLAPQLLDRERPVITYCHDAICDLGPRAAYWLELQGFRVKLYDAGKMDWLSNGLPYEGDADLIARHLQRLPIGASDETVAAIAERAGDAPLAAVVGPDGVLVGVLDSQALSSPGDRPATTVMAFGPSTVRPSEERAKLDERMTKKHVKGIVVTDTCGRPLGLYEPNPR
jgi:rhodanese-related sulfurtransferase